MSENQVTEIPKVEKPVRKQTKQSIRERVWQDLFRKKFSVFPRPFGRIPNFKGAQEAAQKLIELEEFQSAKSVEVNPDKPLEPCRILVLGEGKELFVPIPQIQGSLLKKLEKDETNDVKKIVSRWGIDHTGKEIGLDDKIHIDLLVLGSVAVSKEGYRIGKGKGFADLEFALLKEMKAIDDSIIIVTVVHDTQVFDDLPKDLFEVYDVPVDYIITPTQIIKSKVNLPKPDGIYWNMITQNRLNFIEVLQKLKEKHESEGRIITLKPSDGNETPKRKRYYHTRRYYRKPRSKMNGNVAEDSTGNQENKTKSPRKDSERSKSENVKNLDEGQRENNENIPPRVKKRNKNKKPRSGYSLRVSNIQSSVRVRDLKSALTEKGIRPNSITWKGFRGYCFLHYSTKNIKKDIVEEKKSQDNDKKDPFAIDNLIELIQDLKINPSSTQNLDVKVMEPITRIETLNVTAV